MTTKSLESRLVEGKTTLVVPRCSVNSQVPPKSPAFFNPNARFGRDVAMLLYGLAAKESSKPVVMADVLAGIGARGIRAAVELSDVEEVHINDLNATAIEYARASAEINCVLEKCTFTVMDACHFTVLHSSPGQRFSIVDIDPFGSPIPYLDCAARSVKRNGLLSVTATDTPALCGIYPMVAFRRYYGCSLKTEYCHELGVRLLLGAMARTMMKIDMGILPIFSHNTRHYFRAYAKIVTGVEMAETARKSLGYVNHCFVCGHRSVGAEVEKKCSVCGGILKTAGPLWIEEVFDATALKELISISEGPYRRMFERALEESGMPPTYFVTDRIADELQVPSPSPVEVVKVLKQEGYRASRTSINPKGVKSDASISIVKALIRNL